VTKPGFYPKKEREEEKKKSKQVTCTKAMPLDCLPLSIKSTLLAPKLSLFDDFGRVTYSQQYRGNLYINLSRMSPSVRVPDF